MTAAEKLEEQIPDARQAGDWKRVRTLRAKAIAEWTALAKSGDRDALERRQELLYDMYVDRTREVLDAMAFLLPEEIASALPSGLDEQVADVLFANNER